MPIRYLTVEEEIARIVRENPDTTIEMSIKYVYVKPVYLSIPKKHSNFSRIKTLIYR